MGNLLEYSGIITKLRAMEARLLTDEQFEEISALTSVTELVSYLNTNSSYQDVLQDMDETMLHRGNIEKRADSLAIPRLHKDLPFLRAESKRIYEADHERIRDRADQLLSAYRDQPL
mgnify:CR=1 FL=1